MHIVHTYIPIYEGYSDENLCKFRSLKLVQRPDQYYNAPQTQRNLSKPTVKTFVQHINLKLLCVIDQCLLQKGSEKTRLVFIVNRPCLFF
jgi:hypothetical protein